MGHRTCSTSSSVLLVGLITLAAATGPLVASKRARIPGGSGGKPGTVVTVPPGADALAAAIAQAGTGGMVVLEAGLHTESGTVLITHPVTILGEPGAVLESNTVPATSYPLAPDPALYVRGTSDVRIAGLDMRPPEGSDGGTAILIEDSKSVLVAQNSLSRYQFGVLIQRGDDTVVAGNRIAVNPGALEGRLPEAHGVVVIAGRSARIEGNTVSGALFAIWACDRDGIATGNAVSDSFIGLILCNVPDGNFLIGGGVEGSPSPAAGWDIRGNLATGNQWGYLVIDGSHDNHLSGNEGSGNAAYDLELTADTFRFGFLTPAAFDNNVSTGGNQDFVVKDCGINNRITGAATLVDTTADPCF